MFSRVPKRWVHYGEKLDSAGKNSYWKARMLLPLLLNRFVAGAPFGAGQSSVISLTWYTYLLTMGFLIAEGGVYPGRGVRSPWPEVALL